MSAIGGSAYGGKKVMVFGTFDLFHLGHENFLKQANKFGDFLFVVVARDKTVVKVKKALPKENQKIRLKKVGQNKLVDRAVLGNLGNKYAIIKKISPEVICLGYDQKYFVGDLEKELEKMGLLKTSVKKMNAYHPKKFKSSILKKKNIRVK